MITVQYIPLTDDKHDHFFTPDEYFRKHGTSFLYAFFKLSLSLICVCSHTLTFSLSISLSHARA